MQTVKRLAIHLVLVAVILGGCGDDAASPEDSGVMSHTDAGIANDAGSDEEVDAGDDFDGGMTPTDAGGDDHDGGDDTDGGGDCPTGMAGPDCAECAPGYQDADGDGECLLGCDATGGMALDCGDHGTCAESATTGERGCVCDEPWTGEACDTCGAGWELVEGGCEPVLGVTDGLRLWYDADHTSVLTNDSGEVTTWPSRAGSFPLVSPSGGRPTLAEGWNGRKVVVFDAMGERVASTGSTNALAGEDFTIFVLAAPTDTANARGLISSRTGENYAAALETTSSGGYRFLHRAVAATGSGGGDSVTTTRPAAEPHLIRVQRSTSGVLKVLHIAVADGGAFMGTHSGTTTVTQAATATNHAFVIGQGPLANFRGHIGEVLVYDRNLTTPEQMEVLAYFQRKWGI